MQTVYWVISFLGLLCHYAIQCFACCTLPLQALEAEAARRLPWVVRLVQAEGRQRSLFASAAQLARTAAACCYASEVRRGYPCMLLTGLMWRCSVGSVCHWRNCPLEPPADTCCIAGPRSPMQASDAWELLGSMLNAARDALRADRQLAREEREAAEAAVDMVGVGPGCGSMLNSKVLIQKCNANVAEIPVRM